MAKYEQRDGDVAVFKEREKKNERGPDWRGTAIIDGVKYEVAFWQKTDTMLAGSIKVAGARSDKPREAANREGSQGFNRGRDEGFSGGGGFDPDDQIPF